MFCVFLFSELVNIDNIWQWCRKVSQEKQESRRKHLFVKARNMVNSFLSKVFSIETLFYENSFLSKLFSFENIFFQKSFLFWDGILSTDRIWVKEAFSTDSISTNMPLNAKVGKCDNHVFDRMDLSIPDNCYGHHGRCPCKKIFWQV